jgi:hypothetical protein
MPPPKLDEQQLTSLYAEYQAGVPRKDLLHKYEISTATLYKYMKLRGVPIRYFGYNDIDFFETIDTEEKAYWLGFIAADGCICPRFRALRVALSRKDRRHLFRLRRSLGIDTRVVPIMSSNGKGQWPAVVIHIVSKDMISDLARLGIKPNKTYDLEWPPIEEDLAPHFIRGYLDGDGCWTVTWSSHNMSVEILGRPGLLTAIQSRLMKSCLVSRTKISPKSNCAAVSSLRYAGNLQCIRIANYLYEDATIFLPRKRDVVLKHYSGLPKHCGALKFR